MCEAVIEASRNDLVIDETGQERDRRSGCGYVCREPPTLRPFDSMADGANSADANDSANETQAQRHELAAEATSRRAMAAICCSESSDPDSISSFARPSPRSQRSRSATIDG